MNDNNVLSFPSKAKKLTAEEQAELDARNEVETRLTEMRAQEETSAPCEATIKVLEVMLESAKKGEISGMAAIAFSQAQKGFNRYNCMNRKSVLDQTFDVFAMTMIGGLEILRSDLSHVAFYREQARLMEELAEEIK